MQNSCLSEFMCAQGHHGYPKMESKCRLLCIYLRGTSNKSSAEYAPCSAFESCFIRPQLVGGCKEPLVVCALYRQLICLLQADWLRRQLPTCTWND